MYTRFIITCAARTGSTMLRYLLDGHPEICCHGEVFVRKGLVRFIFKNRRSFGLSQGYKELQQAYQQKPLEDFLSKDLLNITHNAQQAVGFKFKTDEFFDRGYAEIADYLRSNNDIKVIHLRRHDLLAQYVSYLFVQKKINPTVSFDTNRDQSSKKIVLHKKQLLSYLDLVTGRESQIEQELRRNQIHRVWYEDLVRDKENYLSEILSFLGVQNVITPSTTQKLILNYQDHVSNLDEVHNWLIQSKYASRMSENSKRVL